MIGKENSPGKKAPLKISFLTIVVMEVCMKLRPFGLLILFLYLVFISGCGGMAPESAKVPEVKLLVVHAGSLSLPFKKISEAFVKIHPSVKVMLESYGSRTAARQVSDLKRDVDVLASADSEVIRQLLYPDHADFCIDFTTNEMVIAYNGKSRYGGEINDSNWQKIMRMEGVETGHSDPNSDPCGYRSIFTMKLAEKFYREDGLSGSFRRQIKKKNVRPKEVDLLAMLEAGELDYIFIYRSVAEQHGLKYVVLPPQINLASERYSAFYSEVFIDLKGKKPGEIIRQRGKPMVYGITIPKSSLKREWAEKFVAFILGEEGKKIMKMHGQPVLEPPVVDDPAALPAGLRHILDNQ